MAKRQRRRRHERRKEHAHRDRWMTRHSVITGVAVGATSVLGFANPASAATYQVNASGDNGNGTCEDLTPGDCTLRDAVYDANANVGYDTVTFASNISGVTLADQINIYDAMYIDGNGAGATSISGNNNSRIFYTNPNYTIYSVNISDLTLKQGDAGTGSGGAIFNNDANLNIYNAVLSGNHAFDGGAIFDYGGYLGGYNTDVVDSTLTNNTATDDGGGFYAYRSAGQLIASTISGNHAGSGTTEVGGGVYNYLPTYFEDDTFAGNSAYGGGGVYSSYLNQMTAINSIFAGNSAAAGFARDFNGDVYAGGSLFQATSQYLSITQAAGSPPNITGVDPQLGALQNNGGPTPTRLLAPTSPAIDKGFSYASDDQRGVGRPIDISTVGNAPNGDGSDIGAVELTAAEATIPGSPPPVTQQPTTKKKKCKKKKKKHSSAQIAKKKKCKKKKKKHSAALERGQTGAQDWPSDTFKVSPTRHAHSD
jgi:parallel beta-helix repeat protein